MESTSVAWIVCLYQSLSIFVQITPLHSLDSAFRDPVTTDYQECCILDERDEEEIDLRGDYPRS